MAFGLAETARLAVRIDLEGNASKGISNLTKQVGGLQKGLGRAGKGVGQIGAGLARAGATIAVGLGGGFIAAAKLGADFEAQLRTINTIARESDEGLEKIGDGIRQLAREGRGDLADLSEGYYDILSAGIDAADAQGVLTAATTLAIGGLSTNAEAVDLLTSAINAYGQSADQATADADLFAKAIELGKVKADEIAATFANVAPIAAQQGIEIEEIAAAYAALTAQGTPAAEVTTQMQRAIVELLDPGKDLLALQKKMKVNFLDIAQEKGLVVALQAMRDAVGGDEKAFKALFGRVEGYKFALQTTGPQQKIYNDALKAMGDSAGTASAQMGERQQGLAFQVNRLKANLIDAGLEISAGFLPQLTKSVGELTTELGKPGARDSLRSIGEDIGSAIEGIKWDEVLDGAKSMVAVFKSALSFAKQLFDIFNALPTEVKGALVGGVALDKLSGGLLHQGAGNILGGLAQGALSRAPGVGKLFAQPVFVTNWPIGFGKGGGGGGLLGGGGGKLGALRGLIRGVGTIATFAVIPLVEEAIRSFGAINETSTAQGQQAHTNLNNMLAGNPELKDMQTSLRAVNDGINNIQANPLLVALSGDSLNELRTMRTELQKGIIVKQGASNAAANAAILPSKEGNNAARDEARKATLAAQATTNAVKNAQSIATRENSAQKTEIANVKSAVATQGQQQQALQRAQLVAQAANTLMSNIHAAGQAVRDAVQTSAVRTGATQTASASRTAGATNVAAQWASSAMIVAAIWAARPIIQSTTIIQKQAVSQRGGATSDSRTRGGV